MLRSIFTIFCFLIFPFWGNSQGLVELDEFLISEYNGRVFIEFQIPSGYTCDGISILRTGMKSDSIVEIGRIPGICGSPDESIRYNFIDENPVKNSQNQYQLAFGKLGFSNPASIFVFDFSQSHHQVWTNLATGDVQIWFSNQNHEVHHLKILSSNGTTLQSQTTNEGVFRNLIGRLPTGIFLFSIQSEKGGKFLTGKIFIP